MVHLLAAAVLAGATPEMIPAPPPQPAMFMVRDADTTVYLFGTFHALDSNIDWFDSGVRSAFQQSGELILETILPEVPQVAPRISYGVRPPAVTPSASFLATARLAINAGRSQGMQVDNGADMVLRHAAEAQGKNVEALETLQFQLNMFNRMPATRVAPAATAARQAAPGQSPESMSKTMSDMQAAWKRGDQNYFVGVLDHLRAGSPEMYRTMFTERNARWADWIAARMRSPGTVFVAVGAGHLAGRDSVLVRLAERGITSQRVN